MPVRLCYMQQIYIGICGKETLKVADISTSCFAVELALAICTSARCYYAIMLQCAAPDRPELFSLPISLFCNSQNYVPNDESSLELQ